MHRQKFGWYPSPDQPYMLCWWDGHRWTGETRYVLPHETGRNTHMFGKKQAATMPREGITHLDGHQGSIEFDGSFIHITKKWRGTTSIPVQQITGVSIVPAGPGMKGIVFLTSASTMGKSTALGDHAALVQNPQALTFRSKHRIDFQEFANKVQSSIVH